MLTNNQYLPKTMNYPEKLEYFRDSRELELSKLSTFLEGAYDGLKANEIIIAKVTRKINASLMAAGFEDGLALVKPRRQGVGYTQVKLTNFSLGTLKESSISKLKLKAHLSTISNIQAEVDWLLDMILQFISDYWAPYARVVSSFNQVVKASCPKKGMVHIRDYERLRKYDLELSTEIFLAAVGELKQLDEEFDELIFEINSIGGKHRGYKSVVCRWPLDSIKIRYSLRTLIKNPELAFVAWNLGKERIVRPISKIKGVGESGFMTTRVVLHLKQRRNEKALLRTGRLHREMTKRREALLTLLDKTVSTLGDLQS